MIMQEIVKGVPASVKHRWDRLTCDIGPYSDTPGGERTICRTQFFPDRQCKYDVALFTINKLYHLTMINPFVYFSQFIMSQ